MFDPLDPWNLPTSIAIKCGTRTLAWQGILVVLHSPLQTREICSWPIVLLLIPLFVFLDTKFKTPGEPDQALRSHPVRAIILTMLIASPYCLIVLIDVGQGPALYVIFGGGAAAVAYHWHRVARDT